MYGVIDVGNCVFCRNVYTNVIFLQNGRICCERPIMYLRQIMRGITATIIIYMPIV